MACSFTFLPLRFEWIDERNSAFLEISDIAGGEGEAVLSRDQSDLTVRHTERSPHCSSAAHHLGVQSTTAFAGDGAMIAETILVSRRIIHRP